MEFVQLKSLLIDDFEKYGPQAKKAIRFIIDNVDEVAMASMRQLAKDAGVNPATMVRLAQSLGFEGFNEMRDVFKHRIREVPTDIVSRAKKLTDQKDQSSHLISDIEQQYYQNIGWTMNSHEAEDFDKVINTILSAKRVFIMGLRTSYSVAFSFYYAYNMVYHNSHLLDGRAGTAADDLRGISKDDVLIAISVSPYTQETVHAVRYARSQGARIVSITDSELSPISEEGDDILIAKNDSQTFFPSMMANLALVETLIALIISRGGDQLVAEVIKSKAQLDEFNAYFEEQKIPQITKESEQ